MKKTVRAVSAVLVSLMAVAALRVAITDVEARPVTNAAPMIAMQGNYSPALSFGP